MFRNTPKISPNTRGDIFQIKFGENDKSVLMKISEVFGTLSQGSLSKRVLKRCFLESGLTNIFTVSNFRNLLAMTIMFFSKMFKICCILQNWYKKLRSSFSLFIELHLIWVGKSSQPGTGYPPSAAKVLTKSPNISPKIRGDIFQINFPKNDEKHHKIALMEIPQAFKSLSHVDCQSLF